MTQATHPPGFALADAGPGTLPLSAAPRDGSKRLRMAVIGVGHLGRHHARHLSQFPDVDLVALTPSAS
jgi:hypothetical protein